VTKQPARVIRLLCDKAANQTGYGTPALRGRVASIISSMIGWIRQGGRRSGCAGFTADLDRVRAGVHVAQARCGARV